MKDTIVEYQILESHFLVSWLNGQIIEVKSTIYVYLGGYKVSDSENYITESPKWVIFQNIFGYKFPAAFV